MKGHIRERSPGHWAIVIDVRDPQTGKRRRRWHSFKGGKREAQVECARLIAAVDSGTAIEPSKVTVVDFVSGRLAQWEAAGTISPRTAQRYPRQRWPAHHRPCAPGSQQSPQGCGSQRPR